METMDVNEFKKARGEWLPSKQPGNVRPKHTPGQMNKTGFECDSIWLTLPKLPKATHPNGSHGHWATVKDAKKKQKEAAFLVAKEAMGNAKGFPWKAASVLVTYFSTSASVDSDNTLAWLKASLDSLQTAGLIENDSGFTFPPVIIEQVKRIDPRKGTFQLIITKTA